MRTKPSINTTYVFLAHKGSIIIIVFPSKSKTAAHFILLFLKYFGITG